MQPPTVLYDPSALRFGASAGQKRLEDERLLAGRGVYSDDRPFERLAWLAFVRSPVAHARIARVELGAARSAAGVLAVWSGADLAAAGVQPIPYPAGFARADGAPMDAPPRTLLAGERVYYVGQPVVAVVAETRDAALDAAEAAAVEYEELAAVADALAAVESGAPQLWSAAPGNVAAQAHWGDAQATEQGFRCAAHVVRVAFHNQRLVAVAMEPRCAIGVYERGRTTLYTQNQTPGAARQLLAQCLGGAPEDYRVVVGDLGGGFGMKTGLANEEAFVCFAARALGRPVKWRAERSEEFLAAHMGRDRHDQAELALDAEGRILALRAIVHANFGATPVGSTAIIPLLLGPKVQTTVYHVPAMDLVVRGVLTNTMATGAYRGAGRPEANYLMERLMEEAGRATGLGPVEVRRRNFIRPEQFPYRTHLGDWYDDGRLERLLEAALARADWDGFPARRAASERRGKLRGRGLSCYLEWTGAPVRTETVKLAALADGTVELAAGTQAMGQGLETSYAQLVAGALEIPIERVRVVLGDTDAAVGVGSVGSRSAFVGGSAAVTAGRALVERARELAAEVLEAAVADLEYRAGRLRVVGTDREISLAALAAHTPGARLAVDATETPSAPSWPNGVQVCEVEVDPETGEVRIVRYTSVDDVGRIVNRAIVEGQIHGGIAQGIGQALMERTVYDAASGQLLTGSLMDYAIPRANDLPAFDAVFDETIPCRTNLLGVKGCGEIGTVGAVPCVVNAVLDALAAVGVRELEMPLTSERIWRALAAAR